MTPSTRNRFSLSLTLRSPVKAIDRSVRPKNSIPDMSQACTSSCATNAEHPLLTSPTKAFSISWPRSPLSRKHSKASQSMALVIGTSSGPDHKEKTRFLRKPRTLGKLIGTISRQDEEEQLVNGQPSCSPVAAVPSSPTSLPSDVHDTGFAVGTGHSSHSSSKLAGSAPESTLPEQTGVPSTAPFDSSTNSLHEPDIQSTHSDAPTASLPVLDAEDDLKLEPIDHSGEGSTFEVVPEETLVPPSASQQTHTTSRHHRTSVDLSAVGPLRTPSVNTISQRQGPRGAFVKRSRSLLTGILHGERQKVLASASTAFPSSYERNCANNPEREKPMSERQRALNIKRARKMAQMFGSEPPHGLFLVDKAHDDDHAYLSEENRHSIATLLSLSTVDLLSMSPTRVRTDSTTSSEPMEGITCPKEVTSDHTARPPFASLVRSVSGLQATSPATSLFGSTSLEPMANFGERRRRAAKLSRFFGVGYHDLSSSLDVPNSSVVLNHRSDTREDKNRLSVDVKVNERRRFWGVSETLQDADVVDVIDKLRDLRAG